VKPIVFILGPSGAGKSHVSKHFQRNGFLYVHIDTDRPTRSFAANGFPREWDEDFQNVNVDHLAAALTDRLNNEHAGAVVSFPTADVFTPEMLGQASRLGVTLLLLWGTREQCMNAAEERIRRKGMSFDRIRYERLNEPAFRTYSGREYDAFRLQAFQNDGSRFPDDEWIPKVAPPTAG
jgi:hypothetical protein